MAAGMAPEGGAPGVLVAPQPSRSWDWKDVFIGGVVGLGVCRRLWQGDAGRPADCAACRCCVRRGRCVQGAFEWRQLGEGRVGGLTPAAGCRRTCCRGSALGAARPKRSLTS